MSKDNNKKVIIIGAGPAGLTASLMLCRKDIKSIVIERDSSVGGIAKTIDFKGFRFDIGGHRFFSKTQEVNKIWHETLGEDLLRCHRLSRIYYNKKFFYYPLRFPNILSTIGFSKSVSVLTSYLKSRIFPVYPEDNFEQWITNRFGWYLYKAFFKTYSEKIWGIPCNELSAEWASLRVKDLTILSTVKNLLSINGETNTVIDTLIDSFLYPKKGSGMMWDKMSQDIILKGGIINANVNVERITSSNNKIESIEVIENGERNTISGTDFISTIPITELVRRLSPPVPALILDASKKLRYRDFIIVALIINKDEVFKDNWIYIHDQDVLVSRIQNFKNWSPEMIPDVSKTCLGLEYFCTYGDDIWKRSDHELIQIAKAELKAIGLVSTRDIEVGTVYRQRKAYPIYDLAYSRYLEVIKEYLKGFDNLYLAGRNGLYRYNNMDHSMLTAMKAVENILGAKNDLWNVY